jgi:hypothetical protein
MFLVERDKLIEGLERLRPRLCLYERSTCDCKYGARGGPHHSEQSGCPELRACIALLKAMPDQEYQRLADAAGALILPTLPRRRR